MSSAEYVTELGARVNDVEPDINAWVVYDQEAALLQADRVDAGVSRGDPLSVLSGIPVGVKDIFNTIDFPTQMGSPIWAGFTPGNDARVVHYARMAGAVVPGKTVTAEFAVHTPGPTKNPHNYTYLPGTSSSGSAAAVASYMVPIALGTQTAGSIIRPASYCGVFGFKPSFGLIPRTGMLKTTDTLDTVGAFARNVEDVRAIFDVVRVKGIDYPLSEAALNDNARQKTRIGPWRVGVIKGPKWQDAEDYARAAFLEWSNEMAELRDIEVSELRLDPTFDEAHEIHSTIYDRALAYYFKEEYKQHTLVSGIMYDIIERGMGVTPDQYRHALRRQSQLASVADGMFRDGLDIILDLSTGGEALQDPSEEDRPDNCLIWTLCGLPALNMPVFKGPTGLPFGAQIIARRFNDYGLLNFAQWCEDNDKVPRETYPNL